MSKYFNFNDVIGNLNHLTYLTKPMSLLKKILEYYTMWMGKYQKTIMVEQVLLSNTKMFFITNYIFILYNSMHIKPFNKKVYLLNTKIP